MTPIHVVGIGLEGASSLTSSVLLIIEQATLLVGGDRHLSYFPAHPATQIRLGDISSAFSNIRQHLALHPSPCVVILTSGDPLFFGLGRLLLTQFSPEQLTFHPHLSAIQLAFGRLKLPWQDVCVVSVHGRSLDALIPVLQQGTEKIAVFTDGVNTPAAIARLFLSLDLPSSYDFWICENLGGVAERVQQLTPEAILPETFAPLNIVVLLRHSPSVEPLDLKTLPLIGLPDHLFLSFRDRPGLMTKREVRVLAVAELDLRPDQVIWDIGAGTGSVAIEVARLVPSSTVYAIEKTAMGVALIEQNCQRFGLNNIMAVPGQAPQVLPDLPCPDRIFIGGSGGQLTQILDYCASCLKPESPLVIPVATLEHLTQALQWLQQHQWQVQLLQVQLSRSVAIADLTRFSPLNPVTIIKAWNPDSDDSPVK